MTDMFFTKTHEWLRDEDGNVCVGITNHAQELLGDMVFVELPEVGESFSAGDELGVVESVKAASDFYAPIDGEVIAVNDTLIENPAMVNSDPEGRGWLVKMKPKSDDRAHLLTAEEYQNELEE